MFLYTGAVRKTPVIALQMITGLTPLDVGLYIYSNTVSSGTLNSSRLYHTIPIHIKQEAMPACLRSPITS